MPLDPLEISRAFGARLHASVSKFLDPSGHGSSKMVEKDTGLHYSSIASLIVELTFKEYGNCCFYMIERLRTNIFSVISMNDQLIQITFGAKSKGNKCFP